MTNNFPHELQDLQTQIDILLDKLDRDSSHWVSDRRERDQIRQEAIHLIYRRDKLVAANQPTR